MGTLPGLTQAQVSLFLLQVEGLKEELKPTGQWTGPYNSAFSRAFLSSSLALEKGPGGPLKGLPGTSLLLFDEPLLLIPGDFLVPAKICPILRVLMDWR